MITFNGVVPTIGVADPDDLVQVSLVLSQNRTTVTITPLVYPEGTTEIQITGHYRRFVIPCGVGPVVVGLDELTSDIEQDSMLYSAALVEGVHSEWFTFDLTEAEPPIELVPIAIVSPATITATLFQPGNDLVFTPAVTTGDVQSSVIVYSYRIGAGSPVVIPFLPSAMTTEHIGWQFRAVATYTGVNGTLQSDTGYTETVVAVPAETPGALAPSDIVVAEFGLPRAPGNSVAMVFKAPGLQGRGARALQWTTTINPPITTLYTWENVKLADGSAINYDTINWLTADLAMYMTNVANQTGVNPTAGGNDYATFGAAEMTGRATNIQFRWANVDSPTDEEYSVKSISMYTCPAVEEPEIPPIVASGNTALWRGVAPRQSFAVGAAKVNFPDYFTLGQVFGGGPQFMYCGDRVGNFVVGGGDMNGFRFSFDEGLAWTNPRGLNFKGYGFSAIRIDPADPLRVIAVASRLWQTPSTGTDAYVGMSVDQGGYFTSQNLGKYAREGFQFADRFHSRPLDCWPTTGGTASTRKWKLATWREGSGGEQSTIRLWLSVNGDQGSALSANEVSGATATTGNGGASWRYYDLGFFGYRVRSLLQSAYDQYRLYLATNNGLFVSTNGGVSWSTLVGSGDWMHVWEVASGELVASQQSDGVWYRAPGSVTSTSFSQKLAKTGSGPIYWVNMVGLAIGALWPDGYTRTVWASRNQAADTYGDRAFYMNDWDTRSALGTTWRRSTHTSYQESTDGHWHFPQAGEGAQFYPHPTDPLRCCVEGFGVYWRTVNGSHFTMTSDGFHGEFGMGGGVAHDDSEWFAICCSDVFNFESTDGCLSFSRLGYNGKDFTVGGNSPSMNGIIRFPASATYPYRRICFVGNNQGATRVLMRNNGTGAWTEIIGGTVQRNFMRISRQNPNKAYVHQHRTVNCGDSFTATALPICGMSNQSDANVIGYNGGSYYRSSDSGATFGSLWFSSDVTPQNVSHLGFSLNCHDWTIAAARTANGNVKVKTASVERTIDLRAFITATFPTVDTPLDLWYISSMEWCSNNPLVLYLTGNGVGFSHVYKIVFAAGYASETIYDIHKNWPGNHQAAKMTMHPITAEPIVYSSGGYHVLPRHGVATIGHHASALWPRLPKPFNGHLYPEE